MSARQSPCYSCNHFGAELYPACSAKCKPLNSFLASIGDLPHRPPEKDIHKRFPPKTQHNSKDLCTKEEYLAVARYVKNYQKRTGLSGKKISAEIGCIPELINSITRDNQKQMTKAKYRLFVEWIKNLDSGGR